MKRLHQGWTLVEVLVSTTILALLIVMMAEALHTTQRSWLAGRSVTVVQQNLDSAASLLGSHLRRATLQSRPAYDATLDQLVRFSDLHFVCGPSAELLAAVSGTCGDAVFFQRPAADTGLSAALQPCGFFVQYGGDDPWKPGFLTSVPSLRRFRLLHFHQPAISISLFQPAAVPGDLPAFSQLTSRSDLYGWFARPIADSALFNNSASIVAENVVAMIVQPAPASSRCYDSRRYQWEPGTNAASLSRHQLPDMIEITLLMVDESAWSRLPPGEADSLATEFIIFFNSQSLQPEALPQTLDALQQWLQARRLPPRISVINTTPGL